MRAAVVLSVAGLALVGQGVTVAAEQPPNIYISVDMEGTVGAVTSEQLGPQVLKAVALKIWEAFE